VASIKPLPVKVLAILNPALQNGHRQIDTFPFDGTSDVWTLEMFAEALRTAYSAGPAHYTQVDLRSAETYCPLQN
jgi:hypothetical protein